MSSAKNDSELDYLLSPRAIRERCRMIYERALGGETHFRVNVDRLKEVATFVTETTLKNYPDLKIPFHSRWGHFQVGQVDRLRELESRLAAMDRGEKARVKYDLAIISVLLDAGSGPGWKYREAESGRDWNRSEGLAVASFRMFMNGDFSSDPAHPLQADAAKLRTLTVSDLEKGFQVSSGNPLAGVQGRLQLLRSLGEAVARNPEHFPASSREKARPGQLYDFITAGSSTHSVSAEKILRSVLFALGPIWPGRILYHGIPLGDVWSHPLLGRADDPKSYVPFHKLSQWLTYSLLEPVMDSGLEITDVDQLTGLAEYRNGGLLLDRKLVELRDPKLANETHPASSPLIVEWRALTVVLLDAIAVEVRKNLKLDEKSLPLAKVLEGGTWWAGRAAAAAIRTDGSPPLKLLSDGTVF